MKKILAILVACAFAVSCQWWHETFSSPEDCALWYCEQVGEAIVDGDSEAAIELIADFMEWYAGLDAEDQATVDAVIAENGGFDDYGYDDYGYDDYDEDYW